jgi:hypothetical protein
VKSSVSPLSNAIDEAAKSLISFSLTRSQNFELLVGPLELLVGPLELLVGPLELLASLLDLLASPFELVFDRNLSVNEDIYALTKFCAVFTSFYCEHCQYPFRLRYALL